MKKNKEGEVVEKMKEKDCPYVAMYHVPTEHAVKTIAMLTGEIKGTYPFFHRLKKEETLEYVSSNKIHRVFFLFDGGIDFIQDGIEVRMLERGSIILDPTRNLILKAREDSSVFEIAWDLTDSDKQQLLLNPPDYPIIQSYQECPLYTESFKSASTISRTIVPHHILPRFSMGSNEAEENNRIEMNNHPAIDQYFFSFPENNVTLQIEERKIDYKGMTLLHVPLASYHGLEIGSGQKMHYLWIDFIVDEQAGMEYLDTVHVPVNK